MDVGFEELGSPRGRADSQPFNNLIRPQSVGALDQDEIQQLEEQPAFHDALSQYASGDFSCNTLADSDHRSTYPHHEYQLLVPANNIC